MPFKTLYLPFLVILLISLTATCVEVCCGISCIVFAVIPQCVSVAYYWELLKSSEVILEHLVYYLQHSKQAPVFFPLESNSILSSLWMEALNALGTPSSFPLHLSSVEIKNIPHLSYRDVMRIK